MYSIPNGYGQNVEPRYGQNVEPHHGQNIEPREETRKRKRTFDDHYSTKNANHQDICDRRKIIENNIAHHSSVRILERRYLLTKTGYKFIDVGITVKLPSYVNIILGDCHGKQISISPEAWKELLEQKRTILPYLLDDKCTRSPPPPMYIENLTIRFGKINNLSILRVETPETRLALSRSTVLNMFDLEYCVNRLVSSLSAITVNVDAKLSRFLDIAATVAESANISKAIRDSDSFDRNDIIECELVALFFGGGGGL